MAKGPGPLLALAGIGALFLLSKSGKSDDDSGVLPGTTTPSGINALDGVPPPDETTVPVEEDEGGNTSVPPAATPSGTATSNPPPDNFGYGSNWKTKYNTAFFETAADINNVLLAMGYNVTANSMSAPPASAANAFMADYDQASNNGYMGAKGFLIDNNGTYDGIIGPHAMRALEIVLGNGNQLEKNNLAQGLEVMSRAYAWDAYFA